MSIPIARKVIRHEAAALLRMESRLDKGFDRVIRLILKSKHPVVLIGMGKPAFAAQKISASLSSTGTPSITLHPADALHGDIGRIPRGSVVILLSNSGETEEMLQLIPLLEEFKTRLVAMTGNTRSSLARKCEEVLDTSVVSEAEPLNLAPTASIACMLAMGDAITMALVAHKGFKHTDFAVLHPGGALGRRLRLRVKEVMRKGRSNPCVRGNATVKEALIRITEGKAGSATVVDARGKCVGIFTDGDLRRHFRVLSQKMTAPIEAFMTQNPFTIREDVLAAEAIKIFRTKQIDELPVVNKQGKVTGLLDVQDLLAKGFVLS